MNRVQEKIKDIVEVSSNRPLSDFVADPSQTLSGYHFTDITAELMAKWINRVVAMPDPNGSSYALAGYRGVGKSHFLATFGAILSRPELRQRIRDPHVTASAERLIRRHYPVAYARRGTKSTIVDEIKAGVAELFELGVESIGNTAKEIIETISRKAGASPAVLIIDTDLEREMRVARDDGQFLSEIAEAAKGNNVFVAIALDDDIAGADGRNSSIAASFAIDYLDHEHLYKIIDAHIFPKNPDRRKVLAQIYTEIKQSLNGFRWSEQRFSSVYPLHPAILETAPFVRLYVQDFALLTFASEAGTKILGRPADSLIALDELFDVVEKDLRKSADLTGPFEVYDKLNSTVVSKIPVMQRLKAKLVLKGLMLLSLNGEGSTSADVAAAMLLFDDPGQQTAAEFVDELIEKFKAAAPEGVLEIRPEGRAPKFGFRLSGQEDLEGALATEVDRVPDSAVSDILRRLMQDRFTDCTFVSEPDKSPLYAVTQVEWRGGLKPARLVWNIPVSSPSVEPVTGGIDIFVGFENATGCDLQFPQVHWQVDEFKKEEIEALKRYHLLASRSDLQEKFRDQIRTVIQSQMIVIEKIWERKFIQYGKLNIDQNSFGFDQSAVSANSLGTLLSEALSGYFGQQYPDHPEFNGVLDIESASLLISGLFGGNVQRSGDIKALAEAFAVPLGIVTDASSPISLSSTPNSATRRMLDRIMALISKAGTAIVPMGEVSTALAAPPFGLPTGAQYLFLTAMVAQRLVEFVTSSGDRIGRRSLDLQIIWNDIIGIAQPSESQYSNEKLVQWATLLTGDKTIRSLESPQEKDAAKATLEAWLESWRANGIGERFEKLPDSYLNTEVWRVAKRAENPFSVVADAVAAMVDGQISVFDALGRIGDAFSDSAEEFAACRADLDYVNTFLRAATLKKEVESYLTECGRVGEPSVDEIRSELQRKFNESEFWRSDSALTEIEAMWELFLEAYSDLVASRHDAVYRSHDLRESFAELLSSDRWWEFQNLSAIEVFPRHYWLRSQQLLRRFRALTCRADVRERLKEHPFCSCGFSASSSTVFSDLPRELSVMVDTGLRAYHELLKDLYPEIVTRITALPDEFQSGTLRAAVESLSASLVSESVVNALNDDELRVLTVLLRDMSEAKIVVVPIADSNINVKNIELQAEAIEWIEETDAETVLN
jgi:hypothetical protein